MEKKFSFSQTVYNFLIEKDFELFNFLEKKLEKDVIYSCYVRIEAKDCPSACINLVSRIFITRSNFIDFVDTSNKKYVYIPNLVVDSYSTYIGEPIRSVLDFKRVIKRLYENTIAYYASSSLENVIIPSDKLDFSLSSQYRSYILYIDFYSVGSSSGMNENSVLDSSVLGLNSIIVPEISMLDVFYSRLSGSKLIPLEYIFRKNLSKVEGSDLLSFFNTLSVKDKYKDNNYVCVYVEFDFNKDIIFSYSKFVIFFNNGGVDNGKEYFFDNFRLYYVVREVYTSDGFISGYVFDVYLVCDVFLSSKFVCIQSAPVVSDITDKMISEFEFVRCFNLIFTKVIKRSKSKLILPKVDVVTNLEKCNLVIDINKSEVVKFDLNRTFLDILPGYAVGKSSALKIPKSFGTFDIETFKDEDGRVKVYSLGYYINDEYNIYYLSDYNSVEDLFISCFKNLLLHNGCNFYVHNLGGYDMYFIFHYLLEYNKLVNKDFFKFSDSILKNGKVYKIGISMKVNKITMKIVLIDSYNILSQSLRDLCIKFNLDKEDSKGYFPYDFVSRSTLNYVGPTPGFSYFSDISKKDYALLYSENYDLREETIKYLKSDLRSLYLILKFFDEFLISKFGISLTFYATISRIALEVFYTKYYKRNLPSITRPEVYNFIKSGYYGGRNEIFIPKGKNLNYIDVNSLYPYVASIFPMGGLKVNELEFPLYCSNNIDKLPDNSYLLDDYFGFFEAQVVTPKGEYLGVLPYNDDDLSLIFPLGKFSGVWFSEELKYARDLGYSIKIKRGYAFNKEFGVFKDYVNFFYDLKSNKDSSLNFVSKSLLNNLFGKFGQSVYRYFVSFLTRDELMKIKNENYVYCIETIKEISYDYFFVVFSGLSLSQIRKLEDKAKKVEPEFRKSITNSINLVTSKESSVIIPAMVNAYARIFIHKKIKFIIDHGYNVYYTDTDSIVTDAPVDFLEEHDFMGKDLGKFKYEAKDCEGLFINTKLYALKPNDSSQDVIIRSRGLIRSSLDWDLFLEMYNSTEGKDFYLKSKYTKRDYSLGEVSFHDVFMFVNNLGYNKRTKTYDKNGKWLNSLPVILDK